MTGKHGPAERDDEEMIAESRLDHLLDQVEAPEPPVSLTNRVHDLGARLVSLPPRAAVQPANPPLWDRLRDWFGGAALRPVALGAALLIGAVVGHALTGSQPPGAIPSAVETAGGDGAPGTRVPPTPLVVARIAEQTAGPDAMSVQGFSLVVPRATLLTSAETGDETGLGNLPLY